MPDKTVKIYAHGGTTPLNTKGSDKVFDKGEANFPLALFANCKDANGSAVENFGTCRIYSFKVREGADLIHDWHPAMKGGEVGFVDKVDGSFIREHRFGATPLAIGGDYETLDDDPYIESDGTSVINTGILPDTDLRMELDYALTTTEQNDVRISGNFVTEGQTIELYVSKDGTKMNFCIGKGWVGGTSMGGLDTRRHTFVVDIPNGKAHMISGFTTVGTWNLNTTSPIDAKGTIPIALFGRIDKANGVGDWAGGRAKVRIYGARFYKGATLVRNLVPCVKGDAAGFRDTVGGTFHTGEFNVSGLSAGGDVERIPDDGYIELVGNDQTKADKGGHYFDTGYKPGPNTRLEFDYAFAANREPSAAGDWYAIVANTTGNQSMFALFQNAKTFGVCLGRTETSGLWVNPGLPAQTNACLVRRTIILDSPNKAVTLLTAGFANYANTNDIFNVADNMGSTLKLGCSAGGNGGYTPLRVYGLKIYESGSLVRDYVPYVNNGQPGLRYGTTFTAFSRNSAITAVGEVIAGGTVATSSPDDGDAYVESFGASAINTRYFPNSATKIELDYQVMLTKKSSTVAGTIDGSGTTFCLWVNGNGNLEPNLGGWCGGWGANGVGVATTHRRTAVFDVPTRSAALYEHGGTTPIATKDSTKINDKGTGNRPVALFAMCKSTDGATMESFGHVRIYRFKVWENDVLVRDFVPYVAPDGTPCMFDAVEKKAFPATGLKVSGRGHNGAEEWIIEPQSAVTLTKNGGSTTLKALAIGAQSYKWTKNGEALEDGANGELTVSWERHGSSDLTDTYTVTPVYSVFGGEVEGAAKTVEVENAPQGLMLIVR